MIEDDWLQRDLVPARPVQTLRHVSYDTTLARPFELADGSSMTALEAQWELLDRGRKYAEDRGLDCIGGDEVGRGVLRRWESVPTGLEADPGSPAGPVHRHGNPRLNDGSPLRTGPAY